MGRGRSHAGPSAGNAGARGAGSITRDTAEKQLHANAYHRDVDTNRVRNLRPGTTYTGEGGLTVTITRERITNNGMTATMYGARVVTPTYGGYFQSNRLGSLASARRYAVEHVNMEYDSRDDEIRRRRR